MPAAHDQASSPMSHTPATRALQRRLDGVALEQLREVAAKLHEQLEQRDARIAQLERELRWTEEAAEMWQRDADNLQRAMADSEFATHKCVGLTKAGEMLVVAMPAAATEGRRHEA